MLNEFGQRIGAPLPDWDGAEIPKRERLNGRYCLLDPLDPDRHATELHEAYASAPDARDWTYLPFGPFPSADAYREWAERAAESPDPLHYCVLDRSKERAVGTLSLMRHDSANGAIEVGNVVFSPAMQRTPVSTEAQYLLMRYAFDELGYRHYEWKCDALNAPSRRAAERLGFTYEGTFRHAVVVEGRNRDTAWFAIVDSDWPRVRAEFERWLDPQNFDALGAQRSPLRMPPRSSD